MNEIALSDRVKGPRIEAVGRVIATRLSTTGERVHLVSWDTAITKPPNSWEPEERLVKV